VKKVLVFTNIASHYRASLWTKLLHSTKWQFHFFFGDNTNVGIKSIDFSDIKFKDYQERMHTLKNYWFRNKILIWQGGVISQCLFNKMQEVILLGDMYCLSTWFAAIICRFRKIPFTFWGHGLYGNETKLKLFTRKIFYRLANKHLLYERRAKNIMVQQGFNANSLYVVFNSLNYDTHKQLREKVKNIKKDHAFPFLTNPLLPVIVFIGRLTAVKKLNLLISAINKINADSPKVNLLLIGNGPEKKSLEVCAKDGLKAGCMYFTGPCYNEDIIGRYLYNADLCVSPGNVGLTAVHSLSYGTAVCTHNNMKSQGPEVESISEGYNGFFFKEDDIDDMALEIENWVNQNTPRDVVRKRCYEVIDKFYNPYYQLKVFNNLLNNDKPYL
jgi:glycosyltransferase involved in cell wall biosynthesis